MQDTVTKLSFLSVAVGSVYVTIAPNALVAVAIILVGVPIIVGIVVPISELLPIIAPLPLPLNPLTALGIQ